MSTDMEILKPTQFMEKYANSFTASLPSHIEPHQWLAVAMDAIRRDPAVERAANNDLRRFAAALRNAARRGLEPGTEQFYLVPFSPRKGMPPVIEGIVGYQGLVEMMYRAGAVQSVKAEVVKTGDQFDYNPCDERPHHVVDWFASDRGETIGAYAYATMEGGATSKVIVMGLADINQIKTSSASASSKYSPWQTNFDAMALKTVVRQLAKWVPTSAEYRREKLRAAHTIWNEQAKAITDPVFDVTVSEGEHVDPVTGEIHTDIIDAGIIDPIHDCLTD